MIRPAEQPDIPRMAAILADYAARELLLPRSEEEIGHSLSEFLVCLDDDAVVGVCAMHIYGPHLAEVRSLAVDPARKRIGIGRRLVDAEIAEARRLGIARVFALTYQPAFFQALGFAPIAKDRLPDKIWKDCLGCRFADDCREEAFIIDITQQETPAA